MSIGSIKPLLRRIVLCTSFPPILGLYRLIYRGIVQIAVTLLGRHDCVRAIYLRRGLAKGECVPGVSDIDLTVVGEGLDPVAIETIQETYHRLARYVFVLDGQLDVVDEAILKSRYTNVRKRFRLVEGKSSWKLLYGEDYLAPFPQPPLPDLYGGLYAEFKVWWTMLVLPFLQTGRHRHDRVLRNSICFKVVSEMVKAELALTQGILTSSRREALSLAEPYLRGEERTRVEAFKHLSDSRFLTRDPAVVDKTTAFVVAFLNRVHRKFHLHPYGRGDPDQAATVDFRPGDMMYGEQEQSHVQRLVQYARQQWGPSYLGAHLVNGCYFELDELLLMLEVDPDHLPTETKLRELYHRHIAGASTLTGRIHVFLLTPHTAFQLDADYDWGWRTLLSPCTNPDVFAALAEPDAYLDGRRLEGMNVVAWNEAVADFFSDRIRSLSHFLDDENASLAKKTTSFLNYWKLLQCELVLRSMGERHLHYPLTIPAIRRGLKREGHPLPDDLDYLETELRSPRAQSTKNESAVDKRAIGFLRDFAQAIRKPIPCCQPISL